MEAVVVRQIGAFVYGEMPSPVRGSDEVLVQVAVTGLCRTDVKVIEVGHRDLELPRIPGEEVVGTVVDTGPAAATWRGRRVYVYPGTSCGECPPCRTGAGNLCRSMRIMGFHRDGGFAALVSVPVRSLIELPGNLSFDEAVLAEPLSCVLNALELLRLQPGERLGVWGGGPAGTLVAKAAEALGARPQLIEPDPQRRIRNEAAVAVPRGPFDAAVVAVGAAAAYHEALAHLGSRGRLAIFSGLSSSEREQLINVNDLHYQEQTLVGAYGCSYRHGQHAIALLASGRIRGAELISHRLPLADLAQGIALVKTRQSLKVLLYPQTGAVA